ncbi:MAG: asparagine synthase (glutamine-hydrolyzing) [Chitinophagaceae bacterium]
MCGIAGLISKDNRKLHKGLLKGMTDVISHRGPDGEGHWISENGQVGLGHRRLSIIDLSHEADQPMHYLNRYTIVFNGEIYNYIELREILLSQGYTFKTQSDTEVLMAMYDRDKEQCLSKLDGMFSFVLYDEKEQTIFCARDRFGEKPFFYSYQKGSHFYFGSEMKCLWAGGIQKEVNNRMLFNYLAYGFLVNPSDDSETFYTNCIRLPHSHYLVLKLDSFEIEIKKYYDINWQDIDKNISIEKAQSMFQELFYTSVKRRLRSDVPVGSSLSGGLDSSLVVCTIDELKKGSEQLQNTFSAVFPGFKKDERKYMEYVIAKTNVKPHFVSPNDEGLIKEIEHVFHHQEEPFGSASIYVQYKVMQLAHQHEVTVLLDGQGADEILAGYHPYYSHYFQELRKRKSSLLSIEKQAYHTLHRSSEINESVLKGWKNNVKSYLPASSKMLRKYYEQWKQIKNPLFNKEFFQTYFKESFQQTYDFESLNESLYQSTMKGNLQTLLRYADRNSMAHSREVRLPFLSHEVVDFLFTLPSEYKIKEGWTKWIMRSSFNTLLPEEITWRKDKIGYEPPQKSWMENEMIKNKIAMGKKKLVENNILSPEIQQRTIQPEDAVSGNTINWKLLMCNIVN